MNLSAGYLVLLQTYPKITVFGVLQLRSVMLSLCVLGSTQLQILTVFALSVRYQPADITLAVSCQLLPILANMCSHPVYLTSPCEFQARPPVLTVASMRLLHILAMSCG